MLLVGRKEKKFFCHKTLLSFYSAFFDRALYGGFKESQDDVIKLPEDDIHVVSQFISWIYSGRLNRRKSKRHYKRSSWIFGDKIGAPLFTNDVIHLLCDYFNHRKTSSPWNVKYTYSSTLPGAKLRLLDSDLIISRGPLLKNKSATRQQNWLDLIAEGGDLTRDIEVTGLCSNQPSLIPYKRSNRPKYLEFEPERTAAAWYVEKMGAEDSFSTKDCGNRALIGGFREGMSQESLKINAVLT
jgi:hypothetical protein